MSSSPDTVGQVRVLAHRGLHTGPNAAPENSLAAFRAAIDLGADFVELDVRRTRDGVLIVHHDPTLADGRAIASLRADELPPLADGQPIPRLAEVADLARQRGAKLAVELKEPGYEGEAIQQLVSRMPARNLELISFDRDTIRAIEAVDPTLRTGMLAPRIPEWLRRSSLYPAASWVMDKLGWFPTLNTAARIGADYVSVEQRMATPKLLAEAAERGIDVDVWTVNNTARMTQLIADGADGIVTNRPADALRARSALRAFDNDVGAAEAAPTKSIQVVA